MGAEEGGEEGGEEQEARVFGMTFPLLTDSNGNKFGKSLGGVVWLTADKLSPYQFYQHLFKTEDADVVKVTANSCFKYPTFCRVHLSSR